MVGDLEGHIDPIRRQDEHLCELTGRTRVTLANSTAAAFMPSTKTGREHCGWEPTDGLYRYNRENETFTRYTENQGLPSSGNSVHSGGSKPAGFGSAPRTGYPGSILRREDLETTTCPTACRATISVEGCYEDGPSGEMFFGGSNGLTAFFPENIRDNPYVPPVVLTSFKIFNKPVPIGAEVAT